MMIKRFLKKTIAAFTVAAMMAGAPAVHAGTGLSPDRITPDILLDEETEETGEGETNIETGLLIPEDEADQYFDDQGEDTTEADADLTENGATGTSEGEAGSTEGIMLIATAGDASGDGATGTGVDAGLYVKKIELSEDFYTGADISSYLSEKESGVKYYDFEGNELDDVGFFKLLLDSGINSVRIRVWNDPYDASGKGYGGGNCDIDRAVTMGKYATEAGLRVLIDFHYSDFWADPSKQKAPKAWEDMDLTAKTKALHDFTVESMKKLKDAGVNVTMVQIGNETTTGMCGETDWTSVCTLIKAGCDAVHEVDPKILRAVHFTDAQDSKYYAYARYLDNNKVDYEVFASSYYPYWHGSYENLAEQLHNVADNFGKKVMVVETSYAYTLEDGDGNGNTIGEGTSGVDMRYTVSEQGQANLVHDVTEVVAGFGDQGIGVFWWEPAWIPVGVVKEAGGSATYDSNMTIWEKYGSGWATAASGDYDSDAAEWYGGSAVDNQAFFDFTGHPLESLNIFNYIRTGTNAPFGVVEIKVDPVTFGLTEEVVMPENAVFYYTDGSTEERQVAWAVNDIDDAKKAGSGVYEIRGTVVLDADNVYDVVGELRLNSDNLLTNPGFEDASMGAWKITDDVNGTKPCVSRKNDSSNVRSGEYCLHFWDDEDISYKVEQTVYLKKGTYKLGTWIEGGDAGADPEFKLYARTDNNTYEVPTGVSSWQQYQNPEIEDIVIEEDGMALTVGVSVKCAKNGWGAWDDFYLYSTSEGGGIMPGMENKSSDEDVTEAGGSDDNNPADKDDKSKEKKRKNKMSPGAMIASFVGGGVVVLAVLVIIIMRARKKAAGESSDDDVDKADDKDSDEKSGKDGKAES